jgi:hypothetical protein
MKVSEHVLNELTAKLHQEEGFQTAVRAFSMGDECLKCHVINILEVVFQMGVVSAFDKIDEERQKVSILPAKGFDFPLDR